MYIIRPSAVLNECSVAARDVSGRQLKFLSRSYSIPSSNNVDTVDVGNVGIAGDVTSNIGDVLAGDDAASANAIAINQQVGTHIFLYVMIFPYFVSSLFIFFSFDFCCSCQHR